MLTGHVCQIQPSPNAKPDIEGFFQSCLAIPVVLVLYLGWKVKTKDWRLYVPLDEMDLLAGAQLLEPYEVEEEILEKSWRNVPKRVFRALF